MRVKILFVLLSSLLLFQIGACNSGPIDLVHLQYGPEKQNTLDLYLPSNHSESTPVIILIHGGAWIMGGNEYTDKTAKDLRNRGFIVANVDYRYVSSTVHGKDLLGDIDKAVTFIQENSAKYNYRHDGFNMAGISAGAHLALLYGYTSGKTIKSITSLCGPTRLDDVEMLTALENTDLLNSVELLVNAHFTPGTKLPASFTDMSPYAHVKAIPTLLFHGDKDDIVPDAQSKFLYEELTRKRLIAKFIPMPGKGHDCGMNEPDSEKQVLDEIENWVKKYD